MLRRMAAIAAFLAIIGASTQLQAQCDFSVTTFYPFLTDAQAKK